MRCLGCAGLTCTQKDPNNSARLTHTKESSTGQEGGDEDRGERSDLTSHPCWRGGPPRRPPRGGSSLCTEASTELRPFALASGHHIGRGKRPEPYGGRPADELRAPRALLPLTTKRAGGKEAQGLACCLPAQAGLVLLAPCTSPRLASQERGSALLPTLQAQVSGYRR